MAKTVHIIEVLETSIGKSLIVNNDQLFSVGQRILGDNGKSYIVKRITLPTNPQNLDKAVLIV